MEILNIKIGGFKNINLVNLDLAKFNALIALNNFGKSNVLEGVEFGIDFINASNDTKLKFMSYKSLIPRNKAIDDLPFTYDITFRMKKNKKEFGINYCYSFEWIKKENKGKRIISESLRIRDLNTDKKYTTYIKRNKSKTYYLSSKTGRCDKPLNVKKNQLALNKLNNFDNLFYHLILNEINNLSIPYTNTLENPNKLFRRIFSKEVKTEYSLSLPENHEIAFFIYSLKQLKPNLYELYRDSVLSLLPDIEDFEPIEMDIKNEYTFDSEDNETPLDFPDKLYDIRVKEYHNNQQSTIIGISSGSQKIFFILAYTISAELNKIPLISFEEIENSIHPGLLQRLLIILDGLTSNTKILTTSHSPYLVQYLDLSSIKIGVPNENGLADFKQLREAKFNKLMGIAEEHGTSVGDLLFDRLIECSNGEFEILDSLCV